MMKQNDSSDGINQFAADLELVIPYLKAVLAGNAPNPPAEIKAASDRMRAVIKKGDLEASAIDDVTRRFIACLPPRP